MTPSQIPAQSVSRFVQAGNATLTIRSRSTGTRFTYRFVRPDDGPSPRERPTWCRVLTGPDNTRDYTYAGTYWSSRGWTPPKKPGFNPETPSARGLRWLLRHLDDPHTLEQAEFWHEGRCGRCGRKLTVPESIASGFGPECQKYI